MAADHLKAWNYGLTMRIVYNTEKFECKGFPKDQHVLRQAGVEPASFAFRATALAMSYRRVPSFLLKSPYIKIDDGDL